MGTHKAKMFITSWPKSSREFIDLLYSVALGLNKFHKKKFPEAHKLAQQNKLDYKLFPDLIWTGFAINYYFVGDGCTPHADISDLPGCSVILVLGEFEGGTLLQLQPITHIR
jgi:hypothetical protein